MALLLHTEWFVRTQSGSSGERIAERMQSLSAGGCRCAISEIRLMHSYPRDKSCSARAGSPLRIDGFCLPDVYNACVSYNLVIATRSLFKSLTELRTCFTSRPFRITNLRLSSLSRWKYFLFKLKRFLRQQRYYQFTRLKISHISKDDPLTQKSQI